MHIRAGISGIIAAGLLFSAQAIAQGGQAQDPADVLLEEEAPVTKGGVLEIDSDTARQIQEKLSSEGHDVEVTGEWDERTQAALAEFQQSRNLPATGTVDAGTLAALGIEPGSGGGSR